MGFAVIQVILFILLQIPLGAGAVSQCGEHHLYLVVSAFERHELLQRKGVLDVPITHRDIVQTLRKEDFQIPCQRDTAFKQTEIFLGATSCFPTKAMPTTDYHGGGKEGGSPLWTKSLM